MTHTLLALVAAVAAAAGSPPKALHSARLWVPSKGYTLMGVDDSPKKDFRIEKYLSEKGALVRLRDSAGHTAHLWVHEGNPIEPYVYVSPDERWIVCVDKLYAGASGAWLYERRSTIKYAEIAPPSFSDEAWNFFTTQTHRRFEEHPNLIIRTGTWVPESHSLLVELTGADRKMQVTSWYCYYDLEKHRFYLDAALTKRNKDAVSSVVPKI